MSDNVESNTDRAIRLIEKDKREAGEHGVFGTIDCDTLCDQLTDRVNDPDLINQHGTPFCEPASIVYGLASVQPT